MVYVGSVFVRFLECNGFLKHDGNWGNCIT